jgi:hypothetical protein
MNEHRGRRARSQAELAGMRLLKDGEVDASIASYRPRPTDIVISPFGKCGTTWLQQTFHALRTRGDMDFDDISRVVPWIETAAALGVDLEAPQRGEPRGFKSHLAYDRIPKGARYVVSFREPKDALVSGFRFMEGWMFEPGAFTADEQIARQLAQTPPESGIWGHLLSWWEQRHNPDVLLLSYEDMSADPESNIHRLAAFCGIPLGEERLAIALERSSLAFMLKHKDRFDDAMMRRLSEERLGLPPGSDSAKVREGKVGSHRAELGAGTIAAIDARWREVVTPKLGFPDYTSFEAALRSEREAAPAA